MKVITIIKIIPTSIISGLILTAGVYAQELDVTMDVVNQSDTENITHSIMHEIELPKFDTIAAGNQMRMDEVRRNNYMSGESKNMMDDNHQARDHAWRDMMGDNHQMRDDANDMMDDNHQMQDDANDMMDDSHQMQDDANDMMDDSHQMQDDAWDDMMDKWGSHEVG